MPHDHMMTAVLLDSALTRMMMSPSMYPHSATNCAGDEAAAVEDGAEEARRRVLRKRVVTAYTLEAGIIFHSIFVGIALGTSHKTAYVQGLTFALLFHQVSRRGLWWEAEESRCLKAGTSCYLFIYKTVLHILLLLLSL